MARQSVSQTASQKWYKKMKENPEKALRYNERKKINLRAARALNKVQKEIKVVEEEAEVKEKEKKQKKRKEIVSKNNDIPKPVCYHIGKVCIYNLL